MSDFGVFLMERAFFSYWESLALYFICRYQGLTYQMSGVPFVHMIMAHGLGVSSVMARVLLVPAEVCGYTPRQ